jgi:predicted DNA binding protein
MYKWLRPASKKLHPRSSQPASVLTATIHIDLDSDFILSELTEIRDSPFAVPLCEVINAEYIKFVIDAGEHRDAITDILCSSDAVQAVESVGDSYLLLTKRSSGALPIIRENHGMLYQMSQFDGTHRVFDVVVFDRESLKAIIEDLRTLGTARLERLTPFADSSSSLSPRQTEVIEHAYNAGYFDWPRRTDAETLATQLDISHATLLEHLRKGQQKLLGEAISSATSTPDIRSRENR